MIFEFGLTAPALADQDIEVDPLALNFGNVEVGATATNVITVSNVGMQFLTIMGAEFQASGDTEFSFTPPVSWVAPGTSVDINIAFTPSSEGTFAAVLVITSDDPDEELVEVILSGEGKGGVTLPVSVDDILAFFDASVADGTLIGNSPGKSADGRKKALRNMIKAADDLIEDGYVADACQQLLNAYQRCDGLPRPPEFVTGPAAPTLAGMILDLMASLGCE